MTTYSLLSNDDSPGWSEVDCPVCEAPSRHRCNMTSGAPSDVPHRKRVALLAERHLYVALAGRDDGWAYMGPRAWYSPAQAAEEYALDRSIEPGKRLQVVEGTERTFAADKLTGESWLFKVTGTGVSQTGGSSVYTSEHAT